MTQQKKLKSTNLNKELTLDDIVRESEKYEELEKITFDDGRHTFIYKYFSPTRIDSALENFGNFIQTYTGKFGSPTESKTMDYLNLHVLLHMSKLTKNLDHTFEEKIDIFDKILDSEIAEKVMDSFDKKEIEKVYIRSFKKLEQYQEIGKGNKELQEKFRAEVMKSNLDNKELIMNAFFGENNQEINGDVNGDI